MSGHPSCFSVLLSPRSRVISDAFPRHMLHFTFPICLKKKEKNMTNDHDCSRDRSMAQSDEVRLSGTPAPWCFFRESVLVLESLEQGLRRTQREEAKSRACMLGHKNPQTRRQALFDVLQSNEHVMHIALVLRAPLTDSCSIALSLHTFAHRPRGQSLSSSASTVPSIDDYFEHNVWNLVL